MRILPNSPTLTHAHARANTWATTTTLAAAMALGASAQAAPVNVMDSTGQTLLGVNGLAVNNQNYDVRFVDGSCLALFDACQSNVNSFMFNMADAFTASQVLGQALFSQALPGALNGTSDAHGYKAIQTPYGLLSASGVQFVSSAALAFQASSNTHAFLDGPFDHSVSLLNTRITTDTSSNPNLAYARWSFAEAAAPAQTVPEPGTLALAAVGLGAAFVAGGKARRRRPACMQA